MQNSLLPPIASILCSLYINLNTTYHKTILSENHKLHFSYWVTELSSQQTTCQLILQSKNMANAIANMVVQRVFDGSISFHDNEIERRPYHRDCECALHESKGNCSNIWCIQRNLSFRKKTRAYSLAITTSA
ncbi:hypothetical protein LINGRAHAP2_LOCUS20965, partial [Linum grandiflorum]